MRYKLPSILFLILLIPTSGQSVKADLLGKVPSLLWDEGTFQNNQEFTWELSQSFRYFNGTVDDYDCIGVVKGECAISKVKLKIINNSFTNIFSLAYSRDKFVQITYLNGENKTDIEYPSIFNLLMPVYPLVDEKSSPKKSDENGFEIMATNYASGVYYLNFTDLSYRGIRFNRTELKKEGMEEGMPILKYSQAIVDGIFMRREKLIFANQSSVLNRIFPETNYDVDINTGVVKYYQKTWVITYSSTPVNVSYIHTLSGYQPKSPADDEETKIAFVGDNSVLITGLFIASLVYLRKRKMKVSS